MRRRTDRVVGAAAVRTGSNERGARRCAVASRNRRRGLRGRQVDLLRPNMATTDRARRAGFDDAILVSTDGIVLEGPTFTCAWVSEGRVRDTFSRPRDPAFDHPRRGPRVLLPARHPGRRRSVPARQGDLCRRGLGPVDAEAGGSGRASGGSRITGGPIAARVAATFVTIVREETTR